MASHLGQRSQVDSRLLHPLGALIVIGTASLALAVGCRHADEPAPPQAASSRDASHETQGAPAEGRSAELGAAAYAAGHYATAAAYWQAEVEAHPDRAASHYQLGLALWKSGDRAEAARVLAEAARLDGGAVKTLVNLSRIQNERGDFASALESARSALQRDGVDVEAHYLEARSLRNLGRIDEAVAALGRTLELAPEHGQAYNLLGLIYLQRRRFADAADALRQAARLEPDVAYIRNNLGRALEGDGRPAEAAEAYRTALTLAPHGPSAALNLQRVAPAELAPSSGVALPTGTALAPDGQRPTGGSTE